MSIERTENTTIVWKDELVTNNTHVGVSIERGKIRSASYGGLAGNFFGHVNGCELLQAVFDEGVREGRRRAADEE